MKIQNLNHATVFDCRLRGIPAQIAVWGTGEYKVMDRRGYAAPWLERKSTITEINALIQMDAEERLDRHQTGE